MALAQPGPAMSIPAKGLPAEPGRGGSSKTPLALRLGPLRGVRERAPRTRINSVQEEERGRAASGSWRPALGGGRQRRPRKSARIAKIGARG